MADAWTEQVRADALAKADARFPGTTDRDAIKRLAFVAGFLAASTANREKCEKLEADNAEISYHSLAAHARAETAEANAAALQARVRELEEGLRP